MTSSSHFWRRLEQPVVTFVHWGGGTTTEEDFALCKTLSVKLKLKLKEEAAMQGASPLI